MKKSELIEYIRENVEPFDKISLEIVKRKITYSDQTENIVRTLYTSVKSD